MNNITFKQATFLLSAAELEQLPPDKGKEIAIIGRSNAGKSSAINTITGIKKLARTSKTPGRTQMINVFELTANKRLTDLPGYGYTKAPAAVSKRWMETVNEYLKTRKCLQGLILVMDSRHPLKEQDQHILQWAIHCQLPVHILLSKIDKLSKSASITLLRQIKKDLEPYKHLVSIQLFSSHTAQGLEEAHQLLDKWFTNC